MNDYIEARFDFEPCSSDITDLAAAFLADAGFESFLPDDRGLTAYIREADAAGVDYDEVFSGFPYEVRRTVTTKRIEGQDWNHEWEKNYFKPIIIDGECVIHSSFHTDVPACRYDIVIDPKMAFGTGHHATTTLMMRRLLARNLTGKTVVDMGTGTGILAIMAAMRGAAQVTGVEIDPAAFANAQENVRLNNRPAIRLIEGDASSLAAFPAAGADLFLANINRNIVLNDMDAYSLTLRKGGELVLSGFYVEDIAMVRERAESLGLEFSDFTEMDRWTSVLFVKK